MSKLNLWALVMDGGRVRFFERVSLLEPWRELAASVGSGAGPGQGSGMLDSTGRPRHQASGDEGERHSWQHQLVEQVISQLAHAHRNGAFQQLLLVAPPAMLGALRDALPAELAGLVRAQLAADLVKLPIHELVERLDTLLVVA